MRLWIKEHKYCLAGLYLFVFLAGFFALEAAPAEPKVIIRCAADDWIPFNEWFVLPYALWYLWVPACMLFFMLKDRAAYLELCFIMFTGATLCLAVYAVWPNGLDLRREITADNFCADLVRLLRSIDPPCNVCPSIHVSSTAAVHLSLCRSRSLGKRTGIRMLSLFITAAICVSTVFIKQHSVIDVLCGWLLSLSLAAAASIYKGGKSCQTFMHFWPTGWKK
ncbi:MAG: phosphatidic acid phosphatase [Clostridium sp.]|nr:phosphatidic acid phosphatase [Clostridium sp.]